MTKITLSALRARFPLGCEVINLGRIRAVVWGYVEHGDDYNSLLLREINSDGVVTRCQWTADPDKCETVKALQRHTNGFVVFG